MPGSIIKQENAKIAVSKTKGKALGNALETAAKTANSKSQGKKK